MKAKRNIFKKMDVFETCLFIIIALYVLSMIFVLGFGLLNSVKYWKDFQRGNIFGLPKKEYGGWNGWYFSNYADMLNDFYVQVKIIGQRPREVYMFEMLWNSLAYSVCMAFFTILSQIMVAYAVAKYDFKFGKIYYNVAVIVMLIPIVGSLASEVQFATTLGLRNKLLGVCLMKCKYTGLYFLVFYAMFKNVSWTYAEAAQMDGAGHLRIFIQIMLPLVSSTIASVFVLQFIAIWNDYYTPMIFLPEQPTISYGLFMYQSNVNTNMSTPLKLAASLVTCVPIVVLFIIFRNRIMGNVTIGGIKG